MINIPNLLLIGAADRNVGKTGLACTLIKKYKDEKRVIGIKITVIKEADGKCPRGGEGCGVCSSLKSNYKITEELNSEKDKDTSKMLRSGASRVYWLRVLARHLDEGVEALFKEIDAENNGSLIYVCESNSARNAIKPGLFLVLKRKGSDYIKASCQKIIEFADEIIEFDDRYILKTIDFSKKQVLKSNSKQPVKQMKINTLGYTNNLQVVNSLSSANGPVPTDKCPQKLCHSVYNISPDSIKCEGGRWRIYY